jgi:hypothetical protein
VKANSESNNARTCPSFSHRSHSPQGTTFPCFQTAFMPRSTKLGERVMLMPIESVRRLVAR